MPVNGNVIDEALPLSIFQMSNQATKPLKRSVQMEQPNAFPAGDSVYTVNVEADAVSIVVFTCGDTISSYSLGTSLGETLYYGDFHHPRNRTARP